MLKIHLLDHFVSFPRVPRLDLDDLQAGDDGDPGGAREVELGELDFV